MDESPRSTGEYVAECEALVRSLALRIYHNLPVNVDLDDLIEYGQVGLLEAARDFDESAGCQFSTFAYYRIRGAIYDGVSKMSWTGRAHYRRLRYDRMANEVLADENQRAEDGTSTVQKSSQWFAHVTERLAVVYLATHSASEGSESGDVFVDRQEPPHAAAAMREVGSKLRGLVDGLPPVERSLIRDVYFEGATLQEAASRLGISKSWASRLHAKVLEDLGRTLRQIGVHDD